MIAVPVKAHTVRRAAAAALVPKDLSIREGNAACPGIHHRIPVRFQTGEIAGGQCRAERGITPPPVPLFKNFRHGPDEPEARLNGGWGADCHETTVSGFLRNLAKRRRSGMYETVQDFGEGARGILFLPKTPGLESPSEI